MSDGQPVNMKVLFLLSCVVVGGLAVSTIELLAGDRNDRFSMLVGYIIQLNLIDTMNKGEFTLFAPTNSDFMNLQYSPDFNSSTLTDSALLRPLLTYHVVNRTILMSDITNEMLVTMANGKQARFNVYTDGNGWTAKTINGKVITESDKLASNGVVHVVDAVVPAPTGDIVDILESDPRLTVLAGLVRLAGIESELKAERRTLFAPSDDAFKLMDSDVLAHLMTDRNLLTDVLKYHAVNSTQYAQGLRMRSHNNVPTLLDGEFIHAQMSFSGLTVNANGLVKIADIPATNGVVHIIDTVLIPSQHSVIVG